MQFFIGILPPEPIYNDIVYLQNKFTKSITEPHITVKAQGGLTEDKNWIRRVEQVAKNTTPFNLLLADVNFFGTDILYISVMSNGILKLHNTLVNVIAPPNFLIEQYFEGPLYIPHLTIIQNTNKLLKNDLNNVMDASRNILFNNKTQFTVESLRIYFQENEGESYEVLTDIALKSLKRLLTGGFASARGDETLNAPPNAKPLNVNSINERQQRVLKKLYNKKKLAIVASFKVIYTVVLHIQTTIYTNNLPCNISAHVRCQEQGNVGNIFGCTKAA